MKYFNGDVVRLVGGSGAPTWTIIEERTDRPVPGSGHLPVDDRAYRIVCETGVELWEWGSMLVPAFPEPKYSRDEIVRMFT